VTNQNLLTTNADGSHIFTPPSGTYVPQSDPLGRTQIPGSPSTKPVGGVVMSPPQLVKNHSMQGYDVYTFKVTVYDMRGTWVQRSTFGRGHSDYADNELVGEAAEIARHPLHFHPQAVAHGEIINPTNIITQFSRFVWAEAFGKLFASIGVLGGATPNAPNMYNEFSATVGSMEPLATYAPHANHTITTCMAYLYTGGSSYLFVGYDVSAGAPALGCEAFSNPDLAAGHRLQVDCSNGKAGTASQPYGFIQAPDGSILMCDANGDLRLANNDVAPNNLTFSTLQAKALQAFPYAVGPVGLANYTPGALWWSGIEGGFFFGSDGVADFEPRGRLMLTSYDLTTIQPIDFPDLQWVTYATIYRGGVAACDCRKHWWYTGRNMEPMDGANQRPVNVYKRRRCRGHAVWGNKFLWMEVEMDTRFDAAHPNSAYYTVARIIEYDPFLKRSRPISKPLSLGWGGDASAASGYNGYSGGGLVGAVPSLPMSPETTNVHSFSIFGAIGVSPGAYPTQAYPDGLWIHQKQPKLGDLGTEERNTDETNPTAVGELFDSPATYTSPKWRHDALDGFEYTPARGHGPGVEALREGGHNAKLVVTSGAYQETFRATEPDGSAPSVDFGDWSTGLRTWRSYIDLIIESHLGDTNEAGAAVNYGNFTLNPLPFTLEVVARRKISRILKL
jgi:hypothetical protein